MTSGKRQIPINNHAPQHKKGSHAAAAAKPETAGGGDDVHAAPQAAAQDAGRGDTGAERDALAAERDAVTAERDSLLAERDGLNDALLRLRAEFDNFRKRASRELIEARERAEGELLADLLPVLDNLERALEAAEHHEEGKVLDGVRMTRDMFVDLLGRAGVEEIEGVGAQFDPVVHEAVMVQAAEQDEGAVSAVLQRGYRQGDRILRPARVAVSTGAAGSAAAGDAGAAADSNDDDASGGGPEAIGRTAR